MTNKSQCLINEFFTNVKGNIFTVRYTPAPINSDKHAPIQNCHFLAGINKLLKSKKLISYIVAREKSKKGILHYHLRFTTQCSKSVVQKWRPLFLDPCFQGQTYFVLHTTKLGDTIKDDNLWKSATYICKDGDIVGSHGYTVSQIQDLIAYGNELKTSKSEPVWRRIISRSRLLEDASDQEILGATEEFYESLDKPLPAWSHLKSTLHNMKWTLQPWYKTSHSQNILLKMNNLSELLSNY